MSAMSIGFLETLLNGVAPCFTIKSVLGVFFTILLFLGSCGRRADALPAIVYQYCSPTDDQIRVPVAPHVMCNTELSV